MLKSWWWIIYMGSNPFYKLDTCKDLDPRDMFIAHCKMGIVKHKASIISRNTEEWVIFFLCITWLVKSAWWYIGLIAVEIRLNDLTIITLPTICNVITFLSWANIKKILTAWDTQTLAKWNIEKVFAEGLQSTSSTIWLIYPVTTAPVVHDGTILHTRQLQRGTLSNELCLDSKVHGAKWGSPGSCWPQMGPILAPWTLLSGYCLQRMDCVHLSGFHTQSMTSHSPPGNHTHKHTNPNCTLQVITI